MFRNNISYAGGSGGFVSLKPGALLSATFPLQRLKESDLFELKVFGKASAGILSCIADRIVYENNNLFPETDDFFNFTDESYTNGIAYRWPGFFTRNTEANRSRFKVGNNVIFSNGDKRSIVSVKEEDDMYLIIRVDGETLNPKDVGLPSKFEVTQ
jgi:hypothetical protein